MSSSGPKIISIAQPSDAKELSKTQKQFNNLIKKIETQKQALLEWQESLPLYNQKITGEYQPLWDTYNQQRVDLVHLLDRAYDDKLFTKTDRAKIKHILIDLAEQLIIEHGREELKEIHNKYSGSDFDADQEETDAMAAELMKSMMGNMFGIDIDDDVDLSSPEKIQAFLHQKNQEAEAEYTEKQRQAEEKRARRKKTKKQLEKEAQKQQESQNISQSIREVYRKLAAALHPDRERDELERERKTRLMQRVNAAYEKKNLLQLLELQLEVEQIDQEHLNNIAEDRLKYFIKILKEQLSELEQEIAGYEQEFNVRMKRPFYTRLSPKTMMMSLEMDIRSLRRDIGNLKDDIKLFQNPSSLKAFLKSYKISKKRQADDFDDFLGDFLHPDNFG
ncbi:MAG: J domain-containing protein [Methylomicrobium sp.]